MLHFALMKIIVRICCIISTTAYFNMVMEKNVDRQD